MDLLDNILLEIALINPMNNLVLYGMIIWLLAKKLKRKALLLIINYTQWCYQPCQMNYLLECWSTSNRFFIGIWKLICFKDRIRGLMNATILKINHEINIIEL